MCECCLFVCERAMEHFTSLVLNTCMCCILPVPTSLLYCMYLPSGEFTLTCKPCRVWEASIGVSRGQCLAAGTPVDVVTRRYSIMIASHNHSSSLVSDSWQHLNVPCRPWPAPHALEQCHSVTSSVSVSVSVTQHPSTERQKSERSARHS